MNHVSKAGLYPKEHDQRNPRPVMAMTSIAIPFVPTTQAIMQKTIPDRLNHSSEPLSMYEILVLLSFQCMIFSLYDIFTVELPNFSKTQSREPKYLSTHCFIIFIKVHVNMALKMRFMPLLIKQILYNEGFFKQLLNITSSKLQRLLINCRIFHVRCIFVPVRPLIYVYISKQVKTYLEHAPLFLSTCRHNVHFKFSTFIKKILSDNCA